MLHQDLDYRNTKVFFEREGMKWKIFKEKKNFGCKGKNTKKLFLKNIGKNVLTDTLAKTSQNIFKNAICFACSLREDKHKKVFFLVVRLLRG